MCIRDSSQYYIKSHGHIAAHSNYCSCEVGGAYQYPNEISYIQGYGAEDYGYLLYNVGRQNDTSTAAYLRGENQRSYVFYLGGSSIYPNYRRFFANRYGQAVYRVTLELVDTKALKFLIAIRSNFPKKTKTKHNKTKKKK